MIAGLPIEIIHCTVDDKAICPICYSSLLKVGEKVIRSEVVYKASALVAHQYVQEIKKCSRCGTSDSDNPTDIFVCAAVPRSLLPHSLASASLVARVMYLKYEMGVPLIQQESEWCRLGLAIYRSTMTNWIIRCSEEWLEPIYKRIQAVLLQYAGVCIPDNTWIYAHSSRGIKASNVIFSLAACAKLNHLNVFCYLCYLLEQIPELDYLNHPDLLDNYLPWTAKLPVSY